MTPRCLLTGGSGFLGHHVKRALEDDGYEVTAPGRAELDASRAEDWANLSGPFDAVIHAAAFVPAGLATPSHVPSILAASAVATHHALTWANARGVRRFVYCSSADVYAPATTLPVAEDAPLGPTGPAAYYGLGKLWGEQLCTAFRAATSDSIVSLRMSQLHGPGMRSRGVVAAFWQRARSAAPLQVNAPDATGDFLYVEDAARAVVAAVRATAPDAVYNVGSGREVTLAELAQTIASVCNLPEARIERGTGTGRRFVLDGTRARDDLAFVPAFTLRQGLDAWLRASP